MTPGVTFSDNNPQAGFSYLEILVVILLMTILLVPATNAIRTGMTGVSFGEASAVEYLILQSKMEQTLKEPFVSLDAAAAAAGSPSIPTSYSDTVTTSDGRQYDRSVYLWPYDGDNADHDNDPFTGTDAGLLYVKVEIDGTSFVFETLTSW